MSDLYKYYEPTDAFVIKMQKMKLSDFAADYMDEGASDKQIRNTYDNRMRSKNLVLYYMHELIQGPRTKEIGTQTNLSHVGKYIKKNVNM